MRFLMLVIAATVAGFLPAQTPSEIPPESATPPAVDPAALVQELADARGRLLALGSSAGLLVLKAKDGLGTPLGVPVLRLVRGELDRRPASDPPPAAETIARETQGFATALGRVIALGSAGGPAVDGVAASAGEEHAGFWKLVRERMALQLPYEEVRSYFRGTVAPGTFDGMFPKTAALGRSGAEAMVALFVDLDLDPATRNLAGEGVAQLGDASDTKKVLVVYNDTLEDQGTRATAVQVLYRLGEKDPFNARMKPLRDQIQQKTSARNERLTQARGRAEEIKALTALPERSGEQETQLTALKKQLDEDSNALGQMNLELGMLLQNEGGQLTNVRESTLAVEAYEGALKAWTPIFSGLERSDYRGNVALTYYNLACLQSLDKKVPAALKALDQAFRWGYNDFPWARQDGDLKNLRDAGDEFERLLKEVQSGEARKRWKAESEGLGEGPGG